jgi:site-specific DNA-cytosine methylase
MQASSRSSPSSGICRQPPPTPPTTARTTSFGATSQQSSVTIGGPPCQGFSNLGTKNVNDPRNSLWREYLRIVQIAKPKVFVIENVDRFMLTPEFNLLLSEAEHGSLSKYSLSFGHLNAADFGVAQRRIRTFVIGSRVGRIPLPEPTHGRQTDLFNVEPWVGTRDRIGAVPEAPVSTDLPNSVAGFPARSYRASSRAWKFTLGEIRPGCHSNGTTTSRPVAADSTYLITSSPAVGARSRPGRPT